MGMAIYETGIYGSGVGKDFPAMGPFRNFQPRILGPGGRFGGIVSGAYTLGKFLWKNRRKIQGTAIVATGAGVAGIKYGKTNGKFRQTYSTNGFYNRRSHKYNTTDVCHCCRPSSNHRCNGSTRRMRY